MPKLTTLQRKSLSLLLVLAGAVCLLLGRAATQAGETSPWTVFGIFLMLGGVVIRLTTRRSA